MDLQVTRPLVLAPPCCKSCRAFRQPIMSRSSSICFQARHFRYSGDSAIIAREVVVDATGKSLPDLMRELVLGPTVVSSNLRQMFCGATRPWPHLERCSNVCTRRWPQRSFASLGTDLRVRGDASRLGLTRETIADMLRPQLVNTKIGQDFVGSVGFAPGRGSGFRFGQKWFTAEMRLFPAV
jgi:hypothetical protein